MKRKLITTEFVKETQYIQLKLRATMNGYYLIAEEQNTGEEYNLLYFSDDGKTVACSNISPSIGFNLNPKGQLIIKSFEGEENES